MAGEPTTSAKFTPTEYNDDWSRNEITTQYIDLYTEYLTLHGHIGRARIALPFQREHTIHNLQNRRLLLESQNRQLRLLNARLENTNLTNQEVNQQLERAYADTQEILREIMDAQPGVSNDDIHKLKTERARLRAENNELWTRIKTEPEWQIETRLTNELLKLEDEVTGLRAKTVATNGEIERLNERYDETEHTNLLLVEENEELRKQVKEEKGKLGNTNSNEECAKKCKGLEENVELLLEVLVVFKTRLTEEERGVVEAIMDT